ncbi:MAG: HD-GYP domain-containing protein [Streptosporangiales bacterium]
MRLDRRTPITLLAVALAVIALAASGHAGFVHVAVMAGFGGLVTIGELLRLSAPGDRSFAPIAVAGGLGYAFLTTLASDPPATPLAQVIMVITVGSLVGGLLRMVVDRQHRLGNTAARALSMSLSAVLLWLVALFLPPGLRPVLIVAMVVVLAARFAFDMLLGSVYTLTGSGGRFRTLVSDEVRARFPYSLVEGLLAIMLALCVDVVGLLGLVVALMPVAATQVAFLRWATTRTTRMETVRSLSRIPELGGYVEPGHSRRVGDLAMGIARELGMSEKRTRDLQLAALMHDIGQVSLVDPVPGGTTSLLAAPDQLRIAHLGGEVIREGGGLEPVARIVEHAADPYLDDAGRIDAEVPTESRIIRVANAYDDLVGESPDPEIRLQAIDRLELPLSTDFDPAVTRALAQLIERRQRLPVG